MANRNAAQDAAKEQPPVEQEPAPASPPEAAASEPDSAPDAAEQLAALDAMVAAARAEGFEAGYEACRVDLDLIAADVAASAAAAEPAAADEPAPLSPTVWIRHSSGQEWEVERGSDQHKRLLAEGHVEIDGPAGAAPATASA